MSQSMELQSLKNRYGIVGRDEALDEALRTAVQVAPTDLSVLIQGESGVGKEVIPRIIHDNSQRRGKKYIAINCGSIPEGTIDSELFGHEKGAFTSAIGEHEGYFGAADGGTLFLDEVGELPMSTQARLLRVLETGEYIRVGSNSPRKTNARIVAATNVNIPHAIREGHFREDLYYRLCTINIQMPPLRDRKTDVVLLFKKFAIDTAGCFLSFVKIDADITLVAEQVAETVGTKFLSERGLDPAPFQISDDLRFRLAAGVALINLTDNGGFLLIHIEPPLGINLEAQAGSAAVG